MTPEQFCYWLHGFTELNNELMPTKDQWFQIQNHLDTVFKKVTPPVYHPQIGLPPKINDNPYTDPMKKWIEQNRDKAIC